MTIFSIHPNVRSTVALVGLLSAGLAGCDAPPDSNARETQRTVQKLVVETDLLRHWAPVHYQDVNDNRWNGRGDFITRFDYDGNWIADDNWDHLNDSGVDLSAWVYTKVTESTTHWFLTYSIFHPRDWSDKTVDVEHENDVEGVTLFVRKDGTTFGALEGMVTDAHGKPYFAAVGGTVQAKDGGTMQVEVLPGESHARPRTYQEAEGHGMYPCGFSGTKCDKNNEDGIKYVPAASGSVPGSIGVWTPVGYGLRDIDELWNKRLAGTSGIDENGRPWSASNIYKSPGAFAYKIRGGNSGGCGDGWFRTCTADAANMAWSSESLVRDPARYLAEHFTFDSAPSAEYLRNDFNVDAAGVACDALTTAKNVPIDLSRACLRWCADAIIVADPFCANDHWDATCVAEVETVCGVPGAAQR